MAHEITATDMMVSGNNEIPWHKLGKVVAGLLTARDCLVHANLGWTVEKKPLYYQPTAQGDAFRAAPDAYGVIRSDTGGFLGTVGARYTPINNVDGLDILDPVIGDRAAYETAGSLRGGEIVWFLAKVDKDWSVNGDAFKTYLLVYLSHNGKLPVTVRFTNVRVVCANTLGAAVNTAKAQVSIRHHKNFADKIEEAHKVLKLQDVHAREFRKAMASLAGEKMTERNAWDFLSVLIPGDDKAKQTRFVSEPKGAERTRNDIFSLFREGKGNQGKTRYDMLNGVTEYVDHKRATRVHGADESASDADTATAKSELRFESTQLSTGATLKGQALELLLN